ncbi:MAG: Dihydrolipoyllysine-residue acetyltransferase component of pyruvate dehydrogenase complex [Candidatus Hydrogenedentes bacterium ADurb.Bin101]|nr:MAG: Dihydrolipoyllysine-residue acetyltransferase component of pyruvate dehydrogenase complex [Candidatus Hydrogenedentes bacterium ADurb.Bin101]HOC68774.1 2-oxo acid dehydrogenase subunit E2 [Candidatus Hydrogenedentota bacterium]
MKEKPFDIQRRVVAHKTVESWDTIPHAGIVLDLDVTEVINLTLRLRETSDFKDIRVTLNTVMLKIIAESIKASPDINAQVVYHKHTNTGKMRYLDSIDIAVPLLAWDKRMITPVLRNVGALSLREVCTEMERLKKRAGNTHVDLLLLEAALKDTRERLFRGHLLPVLKRLWFNFVSGDRLVLPSRKERNEYYRISSEERLVAEDLLNASTLVSNAGSIMPGLRFHGAFLEIIPPQITAMVLADVQKKPTVIQDGTGSDIIAIRQIMPLTFFLDHRALDGEHITGFMKRVVYLCAHPDMLLETGDN